MKVITVSGSTATVEDVNIISWTVKSVVNPFTGQPLTTSQTWLFSGVVGLAGVCGGYALSRSKYKSKIDKIAGLDSGMSDVQVG